MVHFDSPSRPHYILWTARIVIFVFILHSVPLDAWAQPPSMAITGFQSGKSSQEEKLRLALFTQLKDNKDIQILNDEDVTASLQEYTSSMTDPKSQAVIASAYERFNAGMQFYRKLDLTNALKEFNASVRGYREGISVLRDNHYLLFSHLYLGIILHFLGRVDEGKKFIQEMVMLDAQRKTRVLPARDFPPKIVELHKQITKEVLARPISVLSIDSSPTGATVMFDGAEVGKTPYIIKDIPSGQHFLSLDLQGHQYYGAPIQVNPGTQNFTTVLKEKNGLQVYPLDQQTEVVKNELRSVAQRLNVDLLILGQAIMKDNNHVTAQVQIFDARNSNFSEINEETMSVKKIKFHSLVSKIKDSAKGVSSVHSVQSISTVKTTKSDQNIKKKEISSDVNFSDFDEKKTKFADDSMSTPIYKKWWFWGVIGVVVAGGGAYLMMKKSPADSNIISIPNPL